MGLQTFGLRAATGANFDRAVDYFDGRRDQAVKFTENIGLGLDERHAMAHCIGACDLVSNFGEVVFSLILAAYELRTAHQGRQQSNDLEMDLDNNASGTKLAEECDDPNCAQGCFAAAKNDQLSTDGRMEGPIIGTGETARAIVRHWLGQALGR